MSAWEFVVDIARLLAVGLLVSALGWAAAERGRVHQQLPHLRRASGLESAGRAGSVRRPERPLRAPSPHEPEGT